MRKKGFCQNNSTSPHTPISSFPSARPAAVPLLAPRLLKKKKVLTAAFLEAAALPPRCLHSSSQPPSRCGSRAEGNLFRSDRMAKECTCTHSESGVSSVPAARILGAARGKNDARAAACSGPFGIGTTIRLPRARPRCLCPRCGCVAAISASPRSIKSWPSGTKIFNPVSLRGNSS